MFESKTLTKYTLDKRNVVPKVTVLKLRVATECCLRKSDRPEKSSASEGDSVARVGDCSACVRVVKNVATWKADRSNANVFLASERLAQRYGELLIVLFWVV